MASPIADLIDALKTKDGLTDVNFSGIRSQLVAPAVVIRPDEPWFEPDTFCKYAQRYAAVVAVGEASAEDGINRMHTIAVAIIANLPAGWDWESVGSVLLDESTGTAFMAAPVRLVFKGEA